MNNVARKWIDSTAQSKLVAGRSLLVAIILSVACLGDIIVQVWSANAVKSAKPYVVMVGQDGVPTASVEGFNHTPTEREMAAFLKQFCEDYFDRDRYTLARNFPDSMLFMKGDVAAAVGQKMGTDDIKKFVGDVASPTIIVSVGQPRISDLRHDPWEAWVPMTATVSVGGRTAAEKQTAHIVFTRLQAVPQFMQSVNPLGWQIVEIPQVEMNQ